MKLKTKLISCFSIALIPTILSNIFFIIPCKTSLLIPNADTFWKMCRLTTQIPNDFYGIKQLFFGLTSNPYVADAIIFAFFFIISMLFFYYFKRK